MKRKHPAPFSTPDPVLDAPIATSRDLHGMTAAEAKIAVSAFVAAASKTRSGRVIQIITGKGRGSAGGAVLKPLVARLIKGPLSKYIGDWSLDIDDGSYRIKLR